MLTLVLYTALASAPVMPVASFNPVPQLDNDRPEHLQGNKMQKPRQPDPANA